MDGSNGLDANGLNENGLSPDEQQVFDNLYGADAGAAQAPKPGILTGAWKGIAGIPHAIATEGLQAGQAATKLYQEGIEPEIDTATGIMRLSQAAQGPVGSGMQYANPQALAEAFTNEPAQHLGEIAQSGLENLRGRSDAYFRPNPQTTGIVGDSLYGLTDVATRVTLDNLIAPGAGLPLAAASEGAERAQDLTAQGVDTKTATEEGLLQGGSLLAMGAGGSIGRTFLQRAIAGVVSNEAFGAGATAADSAILRANGYNDLADQEHWNDRASLIANGLIGVFFGALPHEEGLPSPRAVTGAADAIDSALAQQNAAHVMATSPGVPTDAQSQRMHVDAFDTAFHQFLNGDDVNVEPIVRGMNTIPRPVDPAMVEGTTAALADNVFDASDVTNDDIDGMLERGEISEDIADRMRRFMSHEQPVTDEPNGIQADQDYATVGGTVPESGWLDSTIARDGDGRPLTVYRGSRDGTTSAEAFGSLGASTGHPSAHLGVYLTSDQGDAARYGTVGRYHLDLRNPKLYDIADLPALDDAEEAATLRKQIESEGHDGIVLDARPYGGPMQYIAFRPEQVIRAHARDDGQRTEDAAGTVQAQRTEDLNAPAGGVSASGPGEPLHPWTPIDDTVSVPYAGGVSDDGRTVYLDKRMPDTVEVDGKTIDAKEAVVLHERTEWPLMHLTGPMDEAQIDALKARIGDDGTVPEKSLAKLHAGEPLTYAEAHQIATLTENHFVREKYGVDPESYQSALKDAIAKAYKEAPREGDIPADLDEKPYANIGETALLQNATKEIPKGTAGTGERADPSVGRLDPVRDREVAQARAAANAAPHTIIYGKVTARDAMKSADEDVAEAGRLAKGIHAAVACFLRFGGDV